MPAPTPKEIFGSKTETPAERPKKRPFLRQAHLTDRALKGHPGLTALAAELDPRKK